MKLLTITTAFLLCSSASATTKRSLADLKKRDNPGIDLLTSLVTAFLSNIPVASPNDTATLTTLLAPPAANASYTLPSAAPDACLRAAKLASLRANFTYGPSLGGGPAYPSGPLGVAKNALDVAAIEADLLPQIAAIETDDTIAVSSSTDNSTTSASPYVTGNLTTLDDYVALYNGKAWRNSNPAGPNPGMLSNYTQDLLFSMQRLANSPYAVRRLNSAGADSLPFDLVDENAGAAETLTGLSLDELFAQGRLFYADYRDQATLTAVPSVASLPNATTSGNSTASASNTTALSTRYAAAVDAYFYIDPTTSAFLPLAIRTNAALMTSVGRGVTITYTPLDSAGDWLLAKMLLNINDFWFAQWEHLAATHQVVQAVWMAALRTIGGEHPISGVLERLTYEVFAVQLLANTTLFSPHAAVDQDFAFSGAAAQDYTTNLYFNGGAGNFQANYFLTDLTSRGLFNASYGPALTHFPFFEDASVIYNATREFFEVFVASYYSGDADVLADTEVQAWVSECNGPAGVIDFPAAITTRVGLTDALVHIAHLVSTAHHAVNTNNLVQTASILPFHPPAFYKPLPRFKSNFTNPAAYLPPIDAVIDEFTVVALFARPLLASTNRTLLHMFDDADMLSKMPVAVSEANDVFVAQMRAFSDEVKARGFDAEGLSQGMPFVWGALDPDVALYSLTI